MPGPPTPRPLVPHRLALRGDLVADGWSDRQIATAVRRGELVRLRHGAYAVLDGDVDDALTEHRLRARAVIRTARTSSVLSHVSALAEVDGVDLWGVPLDTVHLTRLDQVSGRREAGVAQHRGLLTDTEVVELGGQVVTAPARSALDACREVPFEVALVLLDSVLRAGVTTTAELRQAYERSEHWRASAHLRLAVMLADARSGSVGESRTRHVCWTQGLPAPELQHEVRDGRGNLVGVVDLAWPRLGVMLEFDGREKYLKYRRPGETVADAVAREKSREDRIRALTGAVFVRIGWADLSRPAEVARRIRDAFALARRLGFGAA